jgi:23S rRNA (guanosine2251-2'-O)-methyltransferase
LPTELNLSGPAAVIVGNEGQGMRSLVAKSCDLLMKLPMKGQIESLNAASAGSIALYLTWQARGFK